MQFGLLLLLGACTVGGALADFLTSIVPAADDANPASGHQLQWKKQHMVLFLLQHVHQTDILPPEVHQYIADTPWISGQSDVNWTEMQAEFQRYYDAGKMHRGKPFAVMHEEQNRAARSLLRLFIAGDYDAFVRLAVWSRLHVNEGMFVYALSLAVLHRPDMAGIVVPAQYEIFPHLYYTSEVIERAQSYKMMARPGADGKYVVDIAANYTSIYSGHDGESRLAYFTEDVGLNEYYLQMHLNSPFWLNTNDYPGMELPRRGEMFMFELHNLLARYHLERLSNGMGPIPEFTFDAPIATGYDSHLRYYNGAQMPVRPHHQSLNVPRNYELIQRFNTMELRIREIIAKKFVPVPNLYNPPYEMPVLLNRVGNLLQANPESLNPLYFEAADMIAHQLLSGTPDGVPAVLALYETSMRDPMFYQLYKKLMMHYWALVDNMPVNAELDYPNVHIEHVEMDRLNTSFAVHRADITHAVGIDVGSAPPATVRDHLAPLYRDGRLSQHMGADLLINSEQLRLKHDHFALKLRLKAKQPARVQIKMFLGPKVDQHGREYTLDEMREFFYVVDQHVVDLKEGVNVIERNCAEFSAYSNDRKTYYELFTSMADGQRTNTAFKPLESNHRGFPLRLLLPRGQKTGLPVQFFFHVMPFDADAMHVMRHNGVDFTVNTRQSFAFPLDWKIDAELWSGYGNMFFYDTKVFHQEIHH